MTPANWLVVVGGVAQLAGIAATWHGAYQTARAFGTRERQRSNAIQWLLDAATATIASIGRRPHTSGRVEGRVDATLPNPSAKLTGNISVPQDALYDPDDLHGSIHRLDERLRNSIAYAVQVAIKCDAASLAQSHDLLALDRQLREGVERLKAADQELATGSQRQVFLGLALIAFGVLAQSASVFA